VGQGVFQVLTYGCYARQDTRTPLRSMAVQLALFFPLASTVFLVRPAAAPILLGLAFGLSNLLGAGHLASRLRRDVGGAGRLLGPSLARVVAGAGLMAVPAWVVGSQVPRVLGGRSGGWVAVVGAAAVGAAVFLLLQAWWRAPELAWLLSGLRRGSRGAPAPEAVG
jgi:putative peptidoglycan lipid II flippase